MVSGLFNGTVAAAIEAASDEVRGRGNNETGIAFATVTPPLTYWNSLKGSATISWPVVASTAEMEKSQIWPCREAVGVKLKVQTFKLSGSGGFKEIVLLTSINGDTLVSVTLTAIFVTGSEKLIEKEVAAVTDAIDD